MDTKVLLDPKGNALVPKGYVVISDEITFLRKAMSKKPLLIQGERLCTWAETYYSARACSLEYIANPANVLQKVFPFLTIEQAQELSQQLGPEHLEQTQISTEFVLGQLYPMDSNLWRQQSSVKHAAQWLLWLYQNDPDGALQAILRTHIELMQWQHSTNIVEQVYQSINRDSAKKCILAWFGLSSDRAWKTMGAFPEAIPNKLKAELQETWRRKIIETRGEFFAKMIEWPLPPKLRKILAQETLAYFKKHPDRAQAKSLRQLRPYCSAQEINDILPPSLPANIPDKAEDVFVWFQEQYLPYRIWQSNNKASDATTRVQQIAKDFAKWYLQNYPQWILDRQFLAFFESANLIRTDANDYITLVVVLDGFPWWDVPNFIQQVSENSQRLTLVQQKNVFGAFPTITEFAKDALLKGVPPRLACQHSALGQIIPENAQPQKTMQQAKPSEVFFWVLREPDHTYHYAPQENLEYKVTAQINAIAKQVADIAETLPINYHLQIIVTTDHGRLFNKRSPRSIPVPPKMQSHGRAAWKPEDPDDEFGEDGFFFADNELIMVYGNRFDVSNNFAISLYENTFHTNDGKQGHEAYPHGGLFPEEVIIPWLVFQRDTSPNLEISITGKGEAGKNGTLYVKITNSSDIHLTLFSIHISDAQQNGEWGIPPLESVTERIQIQPWPTKLEAHTSTARLLFRMPDNQIFEQTISPQLKVTEMYSRDDSLLKDLDL